MQGLSIGHIIVIAVVVLVLFGRGKVSSLMGEVGKGITAFKKGIGESTSPAAGGVQKDATDQDKT